MIRNRVQRTEEDEEQIRRAPVTRYSPDYRQGLSSEQVKERRRHGWSNEAVEPPSKTTKDIVRENVFTYFNLIFIIFAILLCIVGSFRDLTFLPIIIVNTLIGIIQEVRAKSVLDKLTMINAPKARVVRNGKEMVVKAEDLVLDDIVIFKAGNQVCADAVVCAGEVQVNESLLTGEADEIAKTKDARLMSGSFIVSGQCYARLEKVGRDSYISRLTLEARAVQEGEQSEMIRSLNRLVMGVGIIIIPIGILLFCQAFYVNGEEFRSSITSMIAAVIGMVPEGLYLLASVALAISAARLAMQKILIHDMKCIETLARVDVLCVDKTGTITENVMKVQGIRKTAEYNPDTMLPLEKLIGDFAAAMSSDNATMAAVKAAFKQTSGRGAVSVSGFSSVTKYSSVTFSDGVYIMGAPEFVLLDKFKEYEEQIAEYASVGARVLAFGTYDGAADGKPLDHAICPLGFLLLANPIRKTAPRTFAYFAKQGVKVKVISGDNPVTVSNVAMEAGVECADQYVDASKLKTEEEMRKAVLNNTVFGRVTPDQKRKFVRILKEAGHTVAMTGDGVNDILALKDADCSIAMASGSDAAAQAAQLVLLESDFSCMPQVVLEGRRVVNNIQRSASLFLVKNIFSLLLSLVSLIFSFSYPLEPSQISLISLFTIGIPAFFLALEPNKNQIKDHFLVNVLLKALPAALTDALAVAALVLFGRVFGVNDTDISTAATMLLAIVGFMILYHISAPLNRMRTAVLAGCAAAFVFSCIFLNDLFGITGMTLECVLLFVVFAIATEPVLRYLTKIVERLRAWYHKLREQKEFTES